MQQRQYPFFIITIVVIAFVAFYVAWIALSVSPRFPVGKNFTIEENESLKSVSARLENDGYITSPLLFRAGASFLHRDKNIQLGGYVFDKPYTFLGVLFKLIRGKPDVPLLSATIPEGSTDSEIVPLVAKELPTFDGVVFEKTVDELHVHGKLFPSTYFLLPSYHELDVIKLMLDGYNKHIKTILPATYGDLLKNENDVLSLAAILEGEAKTKNDMEIVSGILLARLKRGMPLQVDVVKATYTTKGLPKIPISNPGATAVEAALHPANTPYLYYITGTDGKMYYAKTFEEHKANIRKYLR